MQYVNDLVACWLMSLGESTLFLRPIKGIDKWLFGSIGNQLRHNLHSRIILLHKNTDE